MTFISSPSKLFTQFNIHDGCMYLSSQLQVHTMVTKILEFPLVRFPVFVHPTSVDSSGILYRKLHKIV
ncbi:hypothetical protein CRD60_05400 [Bifidobacterium aemilianum]|uniref:Uncharacterized protein n=1 Tax=Bifidobacterium aemilianum TaxID=2493120 RepID=A0A366K7N3_9BIFI|nr:hypothetical protein CRD60_05400 [Bifidobacterium aemilianum]